MDVLHEKSPQGERAGPEMRERIRAFDWAHTELGDMATWPASLKTIVEIATGVALPLMVWWGENAIQIYNDAARDELFAEQHPAALGAPAREVWGQTWDELGPAVERVRAGGGATTLDALAGDDRKTCSFSLAPIPTERGGIGGVLAITRPTPPSTSVLEAYRDHMRSLFMYAPAPICVLRGPQHIVEVANVAMAAAFDRDVSDVIGRPAFDAVPEIAPLFAPLLDHIMRTGESRTFEELQYRSDATADGKTLGRYANALFAPVGDVHGTVDAVLIIAVEITEAVRARNEAQQLRALAEAANRAKDEFLAMLGHELRNPLAPISTALEIMRLRGMTGREVDVIERQVGHLTRLVDDLLDVSRVIGGKIELHRRDLETADLVAEALEVSSPLLEQRGQLVDVDVPQHDLGVNADRERMVQVISNLLTNAAKYSEPGSRITIRGTRTGDRVRLSIRDRGAGIASEMLSRVFDPFVQQPQTIDRARGGIGLGLSLVRSFVELHGGTVSAASDGPGQGSEFTIELPARGSIHTPALQAAPELTAQSGARTKILVVDDNEDAAATLGAALEHLGYEVAIAHDGPSALHVATSFDPDIAVLDLGLPVMDGFELAERLQQQQPPTHQPHLVALTGYGLDSDRQQSARAGFERHLVKPVGLGTLSRIVSELVSQDR